MAKLEFNSLKTAELVTALSSDTNAIELIKSISDSPASIKSLVSIYHGRRMMGESIQDAYASTLLIYSKVLRKID